MLWVCRSCGIYHPSNAAVTRHRRGGRCGGANTAEESKEDEQEEENALREVEDEVAGELLMNPVFVDASDDEDYEF